MKKRFFFTLFVIIMVVLPSQAGADELRDVVKKAEDARKIAVDFESPSYFPSEWEAAEAKYTDAGSNETLDAYNIAADAFIALLNLTIPLYAQAREDEIMVLRNNLVSIGIRDWFPEHLSIADQASLLALSQYEEQDHYTARDSAAKALTLYLVLVKICDAWLVQEEITEREFVSFDSENFEQTGKVMAESLNAFSAGDTDSAQEKAEDALLRYQLVLSNGWAGYAVQRSTATAEARQTALDNKAVIAIRELFHEADESYNEAKKIFDAKNYEEAANQFINAEAMFIAITHSIVEKRNFAAAAIEEARKKIEESEETAKQAEINLKGETK